MLASPFLAHHKPITEHMSFDAQEIFTTPGAKTTKLKSGRLGAPTTRFATSILPGKENQRTRAELGATGAQNAVNFDKINKESHDEDERPCEHCGLEINIE